MEEIQKRLDALRGNNPDVPPYNTREQNSAVITRKNNKRFVNRLIKEREREISNLSKGIVKKRKSLNFNFPDTPPQTPPPLFNYDIDFPPLSKILKT